jgi:hypothetical protein
MTLRDVVKMRLRRKSKYGVVRLKNGGEWIIFFAADTQPSI